MSLVYSAIVPHTPVLIPGIGKENIKSLPNTVGAFRKLAEKLAENGTETIIIISPHGMVQPDAFSMDLSPEFAADFVEFGDFSTKKKWPGDVGLAHRIRESLETKARLQLVTSEKLDYGSSVPLFLLTEKLPDVKIIPLYYSGLDYDEHYELGQMLTKELILSGTRISVIASGDLSHRLSKDAPAGYSPKGRKFDKKIVEILMRKTPKKLLEIDRELAVEAGQCGLKSILIQQGVLDSMSYETELLSYETAFGVGYLAMGFEL